MSWCEIYKPKTTKEIIGQSISAKKLKHFLENTKRKKNCIILTGKNGIGKTLLAETLLKELDYHIKYIDDEHKLEKVANFSLMFNKNKKTAIIYENVYMEKQAADIKIIKKCKQPIIFIADSFDIDKYKPLKKVSETIYMRTPTLKEQISFLTNILKQEKLKIPKADIELACRKSSGDMRSLLINSQFWKESLSSKHKVPKQEYSESYEKLIKSDYWKDKFDIQKETENNLKEKDERNVNIFKMVPEFFDYENTTQDKAERYFIDTGYLPDLLFFNYPNAKIAVDDNKYNQLKKDMRRAASRSQQAQALAHRAMKKEVLDYKIKQAKEHYKQAGEKIKIVKKPKIKDEDVKIQYKINCLAESSEKFSTSDIMKYNVPEETYKYITADACNPCSGMLMEKDMKYTKPKSKEKFTYS